MAEQADARGLNPRAVHTACGFESHSGHHTSRTSHDTQCKDNMVPVSYDHRQWFRRAQLAEKTADEALLHQLAVDTNFRVRREVASNLATPPPVLQELAHDQNDGVRRRLAAHPHANDEVLRILATDVEKRVRQLVASHDDTPTDVLEALSGDTVATVRHTAEQRLSGKRPLADS